MGSSHPHKLGAVAHDSPTASFQEEDLNEAGPQNSTDTLLLKPMADRTVDTREVKPQDDSEEAESHHDSVPIWQPFWLRKPILITFSCWFLCCTIALTILLFLSKRDGGIGGANGNFGYLYRFAPTAILTLVAVFLSRVESQVLRYYPWALIQQSNGCGPEVYQLNYTSMILPVVVFRSLQRKHFLVTLVTTTLIILRVQIILSPALFQMGAVPRLQSAEVQISNDFVISEDRINTTTPTFFYHRLAMDQFDMEFPFGVSEYGVYQTFELLRQEHGTRGTLDKPLQITVDGLFIDMQCSPLVDYNISGEYSEERTMALPGSNVTYGIFNLTGDFEFESCNVPVRDYFSVQDVKSAIPIWSMRTFEKPPCPFLPQKNKQFSYSGCLFESTGNNGTSLPLATCAALVCSPTEWLSKVEISDNGFVPHVTVLPNAESKTVKSSIWAMLGKAVPIMKGGWEDNGGVKNAVMGPVKLNNNLRHQSQDIYDKSLYQNTILNQAVMNVTRAFGPFIAHYLLREENRAEATGFLTTQVEILQANQGICMAMIILSLVSTLSMVFMVFQSAKISEVWHRNPTTLLGFLTVMKIDKDTWIQEDCSKGQHGSRRWSQSCSSSTILKPQLRIVFILYVLGLIAGLIVTSRTSEIHDGLATVGDDHYISFLWRVMPALAMFLVASYVNTVDHEIRDLAILFKLSLGNCSAAQLDTSLLDMLGIRALYHSISMKAYTITFSQSLATLCAFLITISSLLFRSQYIPGSVNTEIKPESWFGSPTNTTGRNISQDALQSLALTHHLSNFTYPKSTYADLLFPTIPDDTSSWATDHVESALVKILAAKLVPTCVSIPRHKLNITARKSHLGTSMLNLPTPFVIDISQDFNCPPPPPKLGLALEDGIELLQVDLEDTLYIGEGAKEKGFAYAGIVLTTPENVDSKLCGPKVGPNWSMRSYLWGNFSSKTLSFDYLSAWKCNYTWVEVPTNVSMIEVNGNLEINHNDPPVQDIASIRPWNPPFPVPSVASMEDLTSHDTAFPIVSGEDFQYVNFSPHFETIMEPFGPIKPEDFANKSQEAPILSALHYNLGFVSVQLASKQNRLALNEPSAGEPSQQPDLPPIKATVIDTKRRRLVQDPTVTFLLIAILALVAVINAYALISAFLDRHFGKRHRWSLDMELKGLAPSGFGSIEMMYELLCCSNAVHYLPEDAHVMSPDILYKMLAETRFRMGWFLDNDAQKEEYTVGVPDDHFQFQMSRKGYQQIKG